MISLITDMSMENKLNLTTKEKREYENTVIENVRAWLKSEVKNRRFLDRVEDEKIFRTKNIKHRNAEFQLQREDFIRIMKENDINPDNLGFDLKLPDLLWAITERWPKIRDCCWKKATGNQKNN